MTLQAVTLDRDPRGVATLTLNRPEKHNAFDAALIAELDAAARELAADASVRAVVLTGAGKSFSAGADLNWMREQTEATREQRIEQATRLARMLRRLNELPKPLIGRINGQAYGGGTGLISVCDVAVAAEGARFGFTEARLGLIPATISPYVVARMGPARAREVFASARIFDADEAARLGLVARAVPAEDLDAAIEAEIAPYLAAAPGAVAASKALLFRLRPVADDATIAMTAGLLADQWETQEARQGIAAFLERRPMPWARG